MTKTKKMSKLIGLRSAPQGLTYDDLDPKMEQPVLRRLADAASGQSGLNLGMSVGELASDCFYGRGCFGKRARSRRQAMSWARNALRRPHREGLVERVERGVWRLTRKGKREVAS